MSQNRDQLLEQMQGLNTALTAVLDQLGKIESEVTAVKSETANQITAIREFLSSPEISALAGPDPAAGPELDLANAAARKMSSGETQEQILGFFLEETSNFAERGILFLQQEDGYVAWKSHGFDSAILESASAREGDPILRSGRERRVIYRADNLQELFPWLADFGATPAAAVCLPLVFGETVPVILYADSAKGVELDSLELLGQLAVLVLKNHYLTAQLGLEPEARQETAAPPPVPAVHSESPAEEEVEEIGPGEEDVSEAPATFESPLAEETGETFDRTEEESAAVETVPSDSIEEIEPPETEIPESDSVVEEQQPEEPEEVPLRPTDWTQFFEPATEEDTEAVEEEPEEISPQTDEEREFESDDFEGDEVPSLESLLRAEPDDSVQSGELEAEGPAAEEETEPFVEPPSQAVPPPLEGVERDEETERKHQEAKRFARLLVSEIKLYHEEAVNEGRRNHDLYDRLRKDIDRSREMYARRADGGVQATEDYFHHEVVRVLADGDENILGDSYPGSQLATSD